MPKIPDKKPGRDGKKTRLKITTALEEATLEELQHIKKFMIMLKAYGGEAEALFRRIDKNAVDAEKYIRDSPPSAGAIALLVSIAQGRFKADQAQKGAARKLAIDPKQNEKAFVRECWNEWQKKLGAYKGKAGFARDMLNKCEHLISQKKIEDWCREWEKENSTQQEE